MKEAHYKKHPEWKWCSKEKKRSSRKNERRSSATDELIIESGEIEMSLASQSNSMRSKSVPANELGGKNTSSDGFPSYPHARETLSELAKVKIIFIKAYDINLNFLLTHENSLYLEIFGCNYMNRKFQSSKFLCWTKV